MNLERVSIEDLVEDWKERLKDPEQHDLYVEKFREILEWGTDPNFTIVPYKSEEGIYRYSLKVVVENKTQ